MPEQKPDSTKELPGELGLSQKGEISKSTPSTPSEEFGDDVSKPERTGSTGPRKTDES